MILANERTSALPADFTWHQSSVGTLLSCPERFRLRFVERAQADYRAVHYAAQLGTADHAGIELILHEANRGEIPDPPTIFDKSLEAFEAAVARSQERGATFDEDGLARALERLEGERLDRLVSLAGDPRIHAIRWEGIEEQFKIRERGGRRWQGTVDAHGVAREFVPNFGALGRELVALQRGDRVIVDWKAGAMPPFGYVERTRSAQLGIYSMALSRKVGRARTFLGIVQDLDRPKAPTDDEGKRIPKRLPKQLNPEYLAAHDGDEAAARKSKRRPKGEDGQPIPKWSEERVNPVWEEACSKPKGPLFREAVVRHDLVLDTIRQAIRAAELGLFPASGAATGQCGLCAYQSVCTQPRTEETE